MQGQTRPRGMRLTLTDKIEQNAPVIDHVRVERMNQDND